MNTKRRFLQALEHKYKGSIYPCMMNEHDYNYLLRLVIDSLSTDIATACDNISSYDIECTDIDMYLYKNMSIYEQIQVIAQDILNNRLSIVIGGLLDTYSYYGLY